MLEMMRCRSCTSWDPLSQAKGKKSACFWLSPSITTPVSGLGRATQRLHSSFWEAPGPDIHCSTDAAAALLIAPLCPLNLLFHTTLDSECLAEDDRIPVWLDDKL